VRRRFAPPHTILVLICPDTDGYSYKIRKWLRRFLFWYKNCAKQQKESALHSLFA